MVLSMAGWFAVLVCWFALVSLLVCFVVCLVGLLVCRLLAVPVSRNQTTPRVRVRSSWMRNSTPSPRLLGFARRRFFRVFEATDVRGETATKKTIPRSRSALSHPFVVGRVRDPTKTD